MSAAPSSASRPDSNDERALALAEAQRAIRACTACVQAGHIPVSNPVFLGHAGHRLMVVGQAPGARGHEQAVPYAGATGKTLRTWLAVAGFEADDLYRGFYLTSLTKCFPGPSATGKGDRAPSLAEIRLCSRHLDTEIGLVRPELVLALGRLSATAFVGNAPLTELVGSLRNAQRNGHEFLVLPLPHPSGVSHWLNAPDNRDRLQAALAILRDLRIERGW